MKEVAEVVRGKSVAVVGNSITLFGHRFGKDIDDHDVVVRMNLGMPDLWEDSEAILGTKTTIWTLGRYWEKQIGKVRHWPALILWMKLTPLGEAHLSNLRRFSPPCPVLRWPKTLETACARWLGGSPSSGIRMVWFLRTHCQAGMLSLFGFSSGGPSLTGRAEPDPSHDFAVEWKAIEELR